MQPARLTTSLLLIFALWLGIVSTAHAARAVSIDTRYENAKNELDALEKDARRSALRHEWEKVERLFIAIHRDGKGWGNAPAALFRVALTREGLARKSMNAGDFKAAVARYEEVEQKYPRSPLADDALLAAAKLRIERLDDVKGGRRTLEKLLKEYPGGDMAGAARALLAGDAGGGAAATRTPAASDTAKPSEGAGREPSGGSPRSASKFAVLRQVSWKANGNDAEVAIELDREARWSHQFVPGDAATGRPSRLLIDVDGARADEKVRPGARISGKVLSRVRVDLSVKGRTRVIVDFRAVERYDVDTVPGSPFRIIARATTSPRGLPGGEDADAGVPVRTPRGKPKDIAEQLGLGVRTIMIDAGHGGKDPGAMANGIVEREVTLAMAKLVGERLRAAGFRVLYTRERDVFIPLDDRTQMANNSKADLFVSLHVNANNDKSIAGVETYYLDLASTSSAAKVASRENSVSEKNLSDLQYILTDLMLSAKTQESRDLAGIVQGTLVKRLDSFGQAPHGNGVRSAPFYVLMGARMPAVLVEVGYCTNPAEAKLLSSPRYRRALADGIVESLLRYKRKLEGYATR